MLSAQLIEYLASMIAPVENDSAQPDDHNASGQPASKKLCAGEDRPEVKVSTTWATLLDAEAPTTLRPLEGESAREHYGGGALLQLEKFLTDAECERLNAAAERVGYGKTSYPQEYRGNRRLITTDPSLAERLWERLRPHVPEYLEGKPLPDDNDHQPSSSTWRACGLNECFRLAKYHPGHRFASHCDANFVRHDDNMSFYTVNIYLNTVEKGGGGATRFYTEKASRRGSRLSLARPLGPEDCDLAIQPEAGLAVVFLQPPQAQLLHDGEELVKGFKYLLRTDIMYRRFEAPKQHKVKQYG